MFKCFVYAAVLLAMTVLGERPAVAGTLSRDAADTIILATGFGTLTLRADRGRGVVEGRFGAGDEGRIVADLVDGKVRGVWTQREGAHRCPASRMGEADWGTVSFSWPSDGRLAARWGFCAGQETLVWDGVRSAGR